MAGCMVWVFGALGEFVLAKVIYSMTEDAKFHYHEDHLKLFSQAGLSSNYDYTSPEKKNVTNGARDFEETVVPNKTNSGIIREAEFIGQPTDTRNSGIQDPQNQSVRHRRFAHLDHKESYDNDIKSIATTNSANLDKNMGRIKLPLQWTDPKSGKPILLWKKIDNVSKWIFPVSFLIFCTMYWIILYIHSKIDNELDLFVSSTNLTISTLE